MQKCRRLTKNDYNELRSWGICNWKLILGGSGQMCFYILQVWKWWEHDRAKEKIKHLTQCTWGTEKKYWARKATAVHVMTFRGQLNCLKPNFGLVTCRLFNMKSVVECRVNSLNGFHYGDFQGFLHYDKTRPKI